MALVGKDQLVHAVAERSGLGIAEARRALEEMLTAIETQLAEGNEVRLTGFGKFSVSRRKAREGRNPQTGESMKIAAKKVPHFSAGAELREAVPQAPEERAPKSKPKTTKTQASATSKTKQAANPNSISAIEESPNEVEQAGSRSEGTSPGNGERTGEISPAAEGTTDEPGDATPEAVENERKRAKRTKKRPKSRRKPATGKGGAAPEDEAALDSSGADEEESAETSPAGKAVALAASGAKLALVAAAGLAAGAAGGLAIMHRR